MKEIEFFVKTSKQEMKEPFCVSIPNECGSSFFSFPGTLYQEDPEFKNNFVAGSAGVNYNCNGKAETQQIIVRYDLGHQGYENPHLNIDLGYTKENNEVRTRKTLEHFEVDDYIEITMKDKENNQEQTERIDLIGLKNPMFKYISSLKKAKQSKYYPLDLISRKISLLTEAVDILGNHLEEFPEEWKTVFKKEDIKPGVWLNDYILLEIKDFYRNIYVKFKDEITFPETSEAVSDFRNEIVGHLKKKTQTELINHYILINIEPGFDKIVKEWKEFRDIVFKKIDDESSE